MDTKKCSACFETYPTTPKYFNRDRARKDGLYPWCKQCSRAKKRESDARIRARDEEAYRTRRKKYVSDYRKRHPERIKVQERRHRLKSKFGISIEEYEGLLAQQEGRCAICAIDKGTTLHVDHDHVTGAIRGLLCGQCNTGLGLFKDNVVLLRKAIKYLG
jgi:hypothetical protein